MTTTTMNRLQRGRTSMGAESEVPAVGAVKLLGKLQRGRTSMGAERFARGLEPGLRTVLQRGRTSMGAERSGD